MYTKRKVAIMMQSLLTCVLLIVIQCAVAIPVKNSKIPPVDLTYECAHKTEKANAKAPIILLHGMSANMNNWDGTYEALTVKTGRRVCRADLRNHGDSPWDDETSVAAMTEDVIHLLDTIGEERAVIIGHSLGGKIAIHTAITHPERVHSIVAEDITPNMNNDNPQEDIVNSLKKLLAIMEKVPEGVDEEEAAEVINSEFREMFRQMNVTVSEDELKEGVELITCINGKWHWKTNYKAILKAVEVDLNSFWTESSGVSNAPALFIYGTKSPTQVNEHEDDIRKQFPKAKFVGVEGAGHSIHKLFPQFEDEVLKFLEETDNVL